MTVKRNGDKVILKDGKVSCSCCEEPGCCMYPADRLGVDYQAEDLPDSLAISDVEQGDFSGEWEKSDSGYQRDGYTLSVVNGQWVIQGFTRTITVGLCLIADVAQATILDQFADTYTVTTFSGTGTVTRRSLCTWEGVDGDGCGLLLFYSGGNPPIGSNDLVAINKWGLIFGIFDEGLGFCESSDIAEKENPQNSPTGQYFSVDNLNPNAVATVS